MAEQGWTYEWPRPAVTVDVVVFTVTGQVNELRLRVLLIERKEEPFAGSWALPGGFVRQDEDLEAAARRELQEETGLSEAYLEQVAAVGTPGRDPRGHTVTVVYVGLVSADLPELQPTGDAASARWFDASDLDALPSLAFDHHRLLARPLEHLRRRIAEAPICFALLPSRFTLGELQALTEVILGRPVDRRNFRRRVKELGFLRPVSGKKREGAHRPA